MKLKIYIDPIEQGTLRLQVFKERDFNIKDNELLAIMGASDIGKSTSLHTPGMLDEIEEDTYASDGAPFKTSIKVWQPNSGRSNAIYLRENAFIVFFLKGWSNSIKNSEILCGGK